MGSLPPGTIDPTKFYVIKVARFQAIFPWDCTTPRIFDLECCGSGQGILNWIAAGFECNQGLPMICGPGPQVAQKILSITGPYDDIDACLAVL